MNIFRNNKSLRRNLLEGLGEDAPSGKCFVYIVCDTVLHKHVSVITERGRTVETGGCGYAPGLR